jgi:hypothetical protein
MGSLARSIRSWERWKCKFLATLDLLTRTPMSSNRLCSKVSDSDAAGGWELLDSGGINWLGGIICNYFPAQNGVRVPLTCLFSRISWTWDRPSAFLGLYWPWHCFIASPHFGLVWCSTQLDSAVHWGGTVSLRPSAARHQVHYSSAGDVWLDQEVLGWSVQFLCCEGTFHSSCLVICRDVPQD